MEYNAATALGELPGGLAAGKPAANYMHWTGIMNRHALTIAMPWAKADRRLVTSLAVVFSLTACSRNPGTVRADVPSAEEAWVGSVCTPVSPDFSSWTRRQVGGVTIGIPPGYTPLQDALTNIGIQGPARRANMFFAIYQAPEARQTYDSYYFRARQKRNACRANLSGYPADVIGFYDRGQYGLIARWAAGWGGEDAGKVLIATITSPRVEEAIELRAVLHTMRPVDSR